MDLNIFKLVSIGDTNKHVEKLSAKLQFLCDTNTQAISFCDSHVFGFMR
jgi:hypothetical protein